MKKQQHHSTTSVSKTVILSSIIMIFIVISGATGFLLGSKASADGKKYLSAYPFILKQYIELCPTLVDNAPTLDENDQLIKNQNEDIYNCSLVDYGISRDGDVYVKMEYQKFDESALKFVGEKKQKVIYFQNNGRGGFSQATDD